MWVWTNLLQKQTSTQQIHLIYYSLINRESQSSSTPTHETKGSWHPWLHVIHVWWEEMEGKKLALKLGSTEVLKNITLFLTTVNIPKEVKILWIWSNMAMPVSVMLFILGSKQREILVSSSIIEDIFWLWPCVPEEEFIPDTDTAWKKEKREINGEGEGRGLCEEQMVSGCNHLSTLVPERPNDVMTFSQLTVHCLFVCWRFFRLLYMCFLPFYDAPVFLWSQTIFNSHSFNGYLL